jgi:hypothetical protein
MTATMTKTETTVPTSFDEAKAHDMAHAFRLHTQHLRWQLAMAQHTLKTLEQEFQSDPCDYVNIFYLRLGFDHLRDVNLDKPDSILDLFQRRAWRVLIRNLGIYQLMSTRRKEEFDKQLSGGKLPELHEDTVVANLHSILAQANDFLTDAIREVCDLLRPEGLVLGEQQDGAAQLR